MVLDALIQFFVCNLCHTIGINEVTDSAYMGLLIRITITIKEILTTDKHK